ncbi:ABC transporter ATP-binding protein [Bacillus coahuilensis]|uniref:ABC transporter ATP-binding protein n=1 Tax=Bacillus coahuilensis TaxID=408580 RepID=UPI0001851133|nr:ABC transporter ATP-binding protein [Bacillus coahuilensis]
MTVRCEHVDVNLQSRSIIRDISLGVAKGEFVGIVGPNGSGKTTLLKSLYQEKLLSSGSVYIHDKPTSIIRIKDLAKEMAVLMQEHDENYDFSLEEMVMMGRSPHKRLFEGDSREDVECMNNSIQSVGLWERRRQPYSQLSGGEKQRVLIARALTQQPSILLLDEPTNHLDIHHQLQLLDMIKGFQLTTVAALHDLNLAARVCDRIIVMHNGSVVTQGSPRKVLTEDILKSVFRVNAQIVEHPVNKLQITFLGAVD